MAKSGPISNKTESSAYYGNLRGVDFSNDHTNVSSSRFAYLVNMYKDYKSKQGVATETIPGYRMGFDAGGQTIHGIHRVAERVLVHCDTNLYEWENYPYSCGVVQTAYVTLGEVTETREEADKVFNVFTLSLRDIAQNNDGRYLVGGKIKTVVESNGTEWNGDTITIKNAEEGTFELESSTLNEGDIVRVDYTESEPKVFRSGLNDAKSTLFSSAGQYLIVDGNGLIYEKDSNLTDENYIKIPTTYIGMEVGDPRAGFVAASTGVAYEQRNLLSPYFRNEFTIKLNENTKYVKIPIMSNAKDPFHGYRMSVYVEGKVTGRILDADEKEQKENLSNQEIPERYWSFYTNENQIGLSVTATKYGDEYVDTAKIIITAEYEDGDYAERIAKCTIGAKFDNRIFLTGNPEYPNTVWFSENITSEGMFPLYFGANNHFTDGLDGRITGLLPISDKLAVLKNGTDDTDGMFLHNITVTGDNVVTRAYDSKRGLNGIQCYGACESFMDDPVFLTKGGLDALGQVTVSYERALEHRSSLIDTKLTDADLTDAFITEFNGYLGVFVNGSVFLADSRQRYADSLGIMQYEWYYLEDIGFYAGQYQAYKFVSESNAEGEAVDETITLEIAPDDMKGSVANPSNEDVKHTSVEIDGIKTHVPYVIHTDYDGITHAYICTDSGLGMIGGVFSPANCAKSIGDTLVFGAGGKVFIFNFDKRNEYGELDPKWYTFNGRTIVSGCATKMDNCGVPHLTKSTVKKSMIAKIKTMLSSVIKVKVRTNKDPYKQIARLNSALFTFDSMDFEDYSFLLSDSGLFTVREKEKKWVEKQIYLYSDEHMRPFALYYLAFRYTVAGRYKD